jgi:D-alanyl-D-alanine-carboxypeptidase/D-alanyl-D-alanine-endopeptidase
MSVDTLVRDAAAKLARHQAVVAAVVGDDVTIHGASGEKALFEIGSVSKVFTSLALACAVTRGKLRLEQPVVDLLPGGALEDHRITLEQLATHTSGLPRLPSGLLPRALLPMADPYARFTPEVLLASVPRSRGRRRPGEKWKYSNLGGGLLGLALATHAGCDYDQLIRTEIGEPIGLSDTVVVPDEDQAGRTVPGHTRWGRRTPYWNMAALAGAGGLRSTAADLATFVRAQLGGSPLADAITLTHEPRHRVNRRLRMGLGWLLMSLDGREILGHNGGTGGFRSFVGFVPADRVGVVALANTTRSVDGVAFKLLKQLAAHSPR